jgi:hypothetical protein
MSGWNLVDALTNKSLPTHGTQMSGVAAQYTAPSPASTDAVGKIRVSTPQSLIDTDFEYSQQATKWESIALQNNRASAYYNPQLPLTVTAITGAGTTTVTLTGTFVIPANSLIYVQNAIDGNANGWWFTAAGGTNSLTFITTNTVAVGNQFNPALSYVFQGLLYSGCGVQLATGAFVTNGTTTVTATSVNPHGFSAGAFIYIIGTTSSGTSINGAHVVATTPTANTFTFVNSNGTVAAAAITNSAGNSQLFARPAGYVESRTFDGGVAFSAGAAVPNAQLIRQTRRYFRYQSGKSIQFSTGTALCPPLFITSITSSGTTATITTRFPHNCAVGCSVVVTGADQGAYNGSFTVTTVPSPTTMTYTIPTTAVTPATGFPIRVSVINWYGSSNRVGFHDLQNGPYFEYDGQMLYAVLRNSVQQISGTVAVTQSQSVVTGTGTFFADQLKPGDNCVIRGQTHRVVAIASNTLMYVSPEYRGASITGALVSKVLELRIPRTKWDDPLDGTGPSSYTLDLTRMQMWYIDYSWYGAGSVRFGLRTQQGQIAYVYQFNNNNIRYEAYMRSGNLPAHYESNGTSAYTYLTSTLGTGGAGTIIDVADTSAFAPSGTIRVQAAGQTGVVEHIAYSSKTATSLTVSSRAVTGGQATAQTFTFSATAPVLVEYSTPDTVASLAHWGSSVIMDGQFNDDKSLVFNYGTAQSVNIPNNSTVPIMAIRIAPSVDNGTTGLLGAKEIINRMQLQFSDMAAVSSGVLLVNLILNGFCTGFSGSFGTVAIGSQVSSSLAQIAVNTSNTATITGGESVSALFSNGVNSIDLGAVRDLGNAILGGGVTNSVPTSAAGVYPDGPDILYIVVTNTSGASVTLSGVRLNWKEAQA